MGAQSNAPVIIKRKKVVAGDGHHGGAWKVAYADFVTAMMAFFMLMWLLNATTEKQRKGIADYFNPTIPINRISGGGEGEFGGTDIAAEMTLVRSGTGASQPKPTSSDMARGDSGLAETADGGEGREQEQKLFEELEKALTARAGESMVSEDAAHHIVTRVTDEGLIVEVFDLPGAPLFRGDTDAPTELLADIAGIVAEVFGLAANDVAVGGHIRSHPVVLVNNPVWDLSSDRADAVRLLLEGAGFEARRIARVTGHADRKHAAPNPMAVRNNRVEMILLRSEI